MPHRTALLALALTAACATRPPPRPRHHATRRAHPATAAPATGAIDIVRSLANNVGPRLAGSAGDPVAVQWALTTMRDLGFANVRAEPVTVPHWERGAERGEITSPVHQTLALAALGGTVATPDGGITAQVLDVDGLDALDALPDAAVAGRIVFFSHVMRRTRTGEGYGDAVGVRGRGPIVAARKGAVGVLVRSIGTDASRFPHTGATRADPAVRAIPAAAISVADADTLHDLISRGAVEVHFALGARTLPDATSANVIGEVTGTAHPDEVILLGAHLDSWDLGRGALDDGAGCAIVLSTARWFLSHPTARTVRVVLYANEENGLAGARAYADAHGDELARHVVALEADAGDGHVFGARFGGAESARARFEALLAPVARLGVAADRGHAYGGADVSVIHGLGVPVIDLQQDMSEYFDHHHTANDTATVVRAGELDQAVGVFRAVVEAVSTMPGDLGRAPPEPVR